MCEGGGGGEVTELKLWGIGSTWRQLPTINFPNILSITMCKSPITEFNLSSKGVWSFPEPASLWLYGIRKEGFVKFIEKTELVVSVYHLYGNHNRCAIAHTNSSMRAALKQRQLVFKYPGKQIVFCHFWKNRKVCPVIFPKLLGKKRTNLEVGSCHLVRKKWFRKI